MISRYLFIESNAQQFHVRRAFIRHISIRHVGEVILNSSGRCQVTGAMTSCNEFRKGPKSLPLPGFLLSHRRQARKVSKSFLTKAELFNTFDMKIGSVGREMEM